MTDHTDRTQMIPRLTPAMQRALRAAAVDGLSRIRGGWVARCRGGAITDTRGVHLPGTVDALVERGLMLRHLGRALVELTPAGREALAKMKEAAE